MKLVIACAVLLLVVFGVTLGLVLRQMLPQPPAGRLQPDPVDARPLMPPAGLP